MRAAGDRQIVNQAPLRDVTSLRIQETCSITARIPRPRADGRECTVTKNKVAREKTQSGRWVGAAKNRRVPQYVADEIVHDGWTKRMREVQLSFVLRLNAVVVKDGVDGIRIGGLRSAIHLEAAEKLVLLVEVVIDAAGKQPLLVPVGYGLSKLLDTRSARQGQCPAATRGGNCAGDSRSCVIQLKNIIVEGLRRRILRNIAQGKRLKSRGRSRDGMCRTKNIPNALGIHVKEGFIPDDWPTQSGGPLVVVLERPGG